MNQINEALAAVDDVAELAGVDMTRRRVIVGSAADVILEAARAYVRDWITCPTCTHTTGGRGMHCDMCSNPCPDCVDGMTPSPELIERVKRAGYAVYAPDEVDRD